MTERLQRIITGRQPLSTVEENVGTATLPPSLQEDSSKVSLGRAPSQPSTALLPAGGTATQPRPPASGPGSARRPMRNLVVRTSGFQWLEQQPGVWNANMLP